MRLSKVSTVGAMLLRYVVQYCTVLFDPLFVRGYLQAISHDCDLLFVRSRVTMKSHIPNPRGSVRPRRVTQELPKPPYTWHY